MSSSHGRDGDDYDVWGRKHPRGPERVGALLDGLLAKVTTPGGRVMMDLVGHWDQLAGRPWAGVSRPLGLHNGVLIVEVADGSTATVLRFQQAALMQVVNRRFGEGTVVDVKLRVRPDQQGSAPRTPRS